ncbi:MAG: M48 family metallopeptidase [Acaryochloridaceae cyanobacterium SU_2_1]|nr:M48 family metallopeptidase [Acaryochloridaceae cyanobacterium SU_2_1]
MSTSKIPLLGLQAEQFRHPLDLEATAALQQLPALPWLVRTVLGGMAEQIFYLENIGSSLLVSDQQLPHLDQLLQEACYILDVERPALYLRQHPSPNAYTLAFRGQQPFIVVHTSLLELLDPPEIQAVLAHELGHLKCEHGLYLTLANLLVFCAGQLSPWGGLIAQGLQMQLMAWVRCAEFTCDRAGLLVSQDAKIMASVLMKLAGGSPTLAPQLNLDAFISQARAYDQVNHELGNVYKALRNTELTHPLPVLRAREIDRWSDSPAYQALLQTHTNQQRATPQLGWRHW